MFIINVVIAFVAIYLSLGIALALLGVAGAFTMKFRNPDKYKTWLEDRPIKSMSAYTQVILVSILFWPMAIAYLGNNG